MSNRPSWRPLAGRHRRAGSGAVGAGDVGARLLLVILCLIWGLTWPAMKVALDEIPPLHMRATTAALGSLTMLLFCLVKRRRLVIRSARAWGHIVVASLLNIVAFSLCSAFAQIAAATSRVAILTYTMPIWAVLLAWLILRERPNGMQRVAIVLCAVGLAVLIAPVARTGMPLGLVLALAGGIGWAAGTVYLKWARIDADPMAVTSWQLTIAFFVIAGCMLIFEGPPDFSATHAAALSGMAFSGVFGNGIAYGLWFEIVRRLPASTASLGLLGSPVIGVVASILFLGERLTAADAVGFALIFAASACVVLGPPPGAARP